MEGRRERTLIPGAVVLTSTLIILWVTAGLNNSPLIWFNFATPSIELPILVDLVAIGIAYYGLGFLCHAINTGLMLRIDRIRFVDFDCFMGSFHLRLRNDINSGEEQRIKKGLKESLLSEFHARLHSHAPDSLLDHCSRRNSAWYINQASSVALLIGCLIGFVIIESAGGFCFSQMVRFAIAAFGIIVGAVGLFFAGHRWNREFWEVAWKWIEWDQKRHELPESWYKKLLEGYSYERQDLGNGRYMYVIKPQSTD